MPPACPARHPDDWAQRGRAVWMAWRDAFEVFEDSCLPGSAKGCSSPANIVDIIRRRHQPHGKPCSSQAECRSCSEMVTKTCLEQVPEVLNAKRQETSVRLNGTNMGNEPALDVEIGCCTHSAPSLQGTGNSGAGGTGETGGVQHEEIVEAPLALAQRERTDKKIISQLRRSAESTSTPASILHRDSAGSRAAISQDDRNAGPIATGVHETGFCKKTKESEGSQTGGHAAKVHGGSPRMSAVRASNERSIEPRPAGVDGTGCSKTMTDCNISHTHGDSTGSSDAINRTDFSSKTVTDCKVSQNVANSSTHGGSVHNSSATAPHDGSAESRPEGVDETGFSKAAKDSEFSQTVGHAATFHGTCTKNCTTAPHDGRAISRSAAVDRTGATAPHETSAEPRPEGVDGTGFSKAAKDSEFSQTVGHAATFHGTCTRNCTTAPHDGRAISRSAAVDGTGATAPHERSAEPRPEGVDGTGFSKAAKDIAFSTVRGGSPRISAVRASNERSIEPRPAGVDGTGCSKTMTDCNISHTHGDSTGSSDAINRTDFSSKTVTDCKVSQNVANSSTHGGSVHNSSATAPHDGSAESRPAGIDATGFGKKLEHGGLAEIAGFDASDAPLDGGVGSKVDGLHEPEVTESLRRRVAFLEALLGDGCPAQANPHEKCPKDTKNGRKDGSIANEVKQASGDSKSPDGGVGGDGKGKSKEGSKGQGSKGKGNVPKAPARTLAPKAKAKENPKPHKAEIKPQRPMKKLFWNSFVLDDQLFKAQTNVWSALDNEGLDGFDVQELEQLFSEQSGGSVPMRAGPGGRSRRLRRRVLEESRRRQVCIMLARLPPVDITVRAVHRMDDATLDKDQVELLLSTAPSADELSLLSTAAQAPEKETLPWDDAESFVIKLAEVSSFRTRLQIWSFENAFEERYETLHSAVAEVKDACHSLQESFRVQRLLGMVLGCGNYLNAGTSRGRADGFSVEVLAQMRSLKGQAGSTSSTTTLLDFLVRQAEKSEPGELANLFGDVGEATLVQKARRHNLADLSFELNAYLSQAQELARTAASGDQELATRGKSTEAKIGELDTLQQLFVEAGEDYRNMCVWFHEGLGKKPRPADEFFGHWHTFFQGVRAALEGLYGGRTKRRKAARSKILRPYDQFRQPWRKPLAGRVVFVVEGATQGVVTRGTVLDRDGFFVCLVSMSYVTVLNSALRALKFIRALSALPLR